ncbi:2-oxoglutarate and iron-dependent oxygenase domain-containing protein 3 isoform X3 [Ambystoma mexicanum]|uniref:2-oxoglutarate and iron-dependent oxygenase domain-containing protein 3 isoform X3 n=1 Tax=Ambystoma mexicanum TaxID=8296 RepID=UPI0037E7E224
MERRSSHVKKTIPQTESQRPWLKVVLLLLTSVCLGLVILWRYTDSEDDITEVLAHQSETVQKRFFEVPCSEDYENHKGFAGCTPTKCGRALTDILITSVEAKTMQRLPSWTCTLELFQWELTLSICTVTSVMQSKIFFLWRTFSCTGDLANPPENYQLKKRKAPIQVPYEARDIRQRIQGEIAQSFGISASNLYLTKPTFFSRMNNTAAKTIHDEYWHPHVDKVTYGSFDYTSLLYLSDYAKDFGGGRFVFIDEGANKTIEPRIGRVSFFTSGSENLHRVEKVRWGTRYAITISFTCNPEHGIGDPSLT